MKTRASLLVTAVVAAAFALGSTGVASAGPALTKGAVKKIAATVVDKAAPDLSVAHAKTADSATSADHATSATTATTATTAANAANAANADKLDQLNSTDLQTKAWTFTLQPGSTAGNSSSYGFTSLPIGTYLASYSVKTTTAPANLQCGIIPDLDQPTFVGVGYGVAVSGTSAVTGSATLTTPLHGPVFECSASVGNPFLLGGSVTFTKIDTLTTASVGPTTE